MSPQRWYYNLRLNRVEPEEGGPNSERLGPYDTYEDAAHALEKARERSEAWEADPRWRDGPDDES